MRIIILFFLFGIVTQTALAASFSVQPSVSTLGVGGQFTARVQIDSAVPINAFRGEVSFSDRVSVAGISYEQSLVPLWVETPHRSNPTTIAFSGIIPGGMTGTIPLFSITFTAEKEGTLLVGVYTHEVLPHDGTGIPVASTSVSTSITIEGFSREGYQYDTRDTEPPEHFTIEKVRTPLLFDGAPTLIFATQDKQSGIAYYTVREGRFGIARRAESPYRLRSDRGVITVTAIDHAGNRRSAQLVLSHESTPEDIRFFVILTSIVISSIILHVYVRYRKKYSY